VAHTALVLSTNDLRHHPGTRKPVELELLLEGLVTSSARVPPGVPVRLDLEAEAQGSDVIVTGTITVPWEGECRRCLEQAVGEVEVSVQEIFQPHPVDGETYPIDGGRIDLEPLVREAVLPNLPLAPLCREDCPGPVPEAFVGEAEPDDGLDEHGEPSKDPRWAALDALRDDT
jgi:uncharacterized protein